MPTKAHAKPMKEALPSPKCRACRVACETFIIPGRIADTKIFICHKYAKNKRNAKKIE